MDKLKAYGSLVLAMISSFNLGLYVASDIIFKIKEVNPHQWFLTSFFGLFFLVLGIEKVRKLN